MSSFSVPDSDPRGQLIAHARHFYQQGWMVGTAGNLSARMPDGSFWITASGCAKGALTLEQFVHLSLDGEILEQPSGKPSAETHIHQVIYQQVPAAQACYHVHSVEANLVSRFSAAQHLDLPPLEMLKGLGSWDENPQVQLPVFANHAHVPAIAAEIQTRFQAFPSRVPALLIRDHGVTVWGTSVQATFHHLEIMEYLFRYMVAARSFEIR
ncbi:methylthioribulose 1-phosphate dehydratase [Synechococcales cyanobacterium C]|uniref:Methylthioribulose-1-phosphate dehydratase n=1 Tax=Petrachloros mirabilis ULC683 TaxID=2781853 RepID=A0A8K2A6E8_9CYAN|nr:methylthioribulose 1-phosphate dehydratase [Petrachloros mirabilis]NCJ05120.1 methylthioribulose 1-phosphate dehydratase [Petrachloros mirabilis ULC683]